MFNSSNRALDNERKRNQAVERIDSPLNAHDPHAGDFLLREDAQRDSSHNLGP